MTFDKTEKSSVITNSGKQEERDKDFYLCCNMNCKNKDRLVSWEHGSGFTNAYNHLRSCIADGKDDTLENIYYDNKRLKAEKEGMGIGHFFTPVMSIKPKVRAIDAYLRLVIFKNCPITIIEDKYY
jgi:hypothetical protein